MGDIKIIISSVSQPPASGPARDKHPDLLEKIREYVLDVRSGNHERFRQQWCYICCLFLALIKKGAKGKLNEKERQALELIEPVILMYAADEPMLNNNVDGAEWLKSKGAQRG